MYLIISPNQFDDFLVGFSRRSSGRKEHGIEVVRAIYFGIVCELHLLVLVRV